MASITTANAMMLIRITCGRASAALRTHAMAVTMGVHTATATNGPN